MTPPEVQREMLAQRACGTPRRQGKELRFRQTRTPRSVELIDTSGRALDVIGTLGCFSCSNSQLAVGTE